MADLQGFNANEVEPSASFEPVPAGKYLAAITATEMKPTKNATGSYLQLTLTILEGEHKGRTLWDRLNLVNPSQQAMKIAQSELSAVCRAVGVMTPKDSCELHNIPVLITVKVKKRKDTDELTNEVKGYESKSAAAAKPPQTSANGTTPPWKR